MQNPPLSRSLERRPDELERFACAIGGSWLFVHGLRRSSLVGMLMVLLGLTLARRAIRDPRNSPARDAPGRAGREGTLDPVLDPVQEASEESFPASDPPSWTPTHA